jgi:hypothetical protein
MLEFENSNIKSVGALTKAVSMPRTVQTYHCMHSSFPRTRKRLREIFDLSKFKQHVTQFTEDAGRKRMLIQLKKPVSEK